MPQINGQEVGATGFGLMGKNLERTSIAHLSSFVSQTLTKSQTHLGFTWREDPIPNEQAFEALRAALRKGMNFWNGGEFYGTPECNSMTLLDAYFAKYPEDADKVVLSIKGAVNPARHAPDGSPEEVRRSIDTVLKQLNGRKKLDIFECARRDPKVPLEVTFRTMQEYIDKGLLGGISLSEVAASTIHEAVKHAKIVAVEVELSIFSPDVLTNGVAAACAQYNIPLIAYSPVGRGVRQISQTHLKANTNLPPRMIDAGREDAIPSGHPPVPTAVPTLPPRELRPQPRAGHQGESASRKEGVYAGAAGHLVDALPLAAAGHADHHPDPGNDAAGARRGERGRGRPDGRRDERDRRDPGQVRGQGGALLVGRSYEHIKVP
jgi:aryl-alcohol dehydrogenase-like predicted oxidoreductase